MGAIANFMDLEKSGRREDKCKGAFFLRPLAFMCGSEDVGKIGGGKIPTADRRSVSARKVLEPEIFSTSAGMWAKNIQYPFFDWSYWINSMRSRWLEPINILQHLFIPHRIPDLQIISDGYRSTYLGMIINNPGIRFSSSNTSVGRGLSQCYRVGSGVDHLTVPDSVYLRFYPWYPRHYCGLSIVPFGEIKPLSVYRIIKMGIPCMPYDLAHAPYGPQMGHPIAHFQVSYAVLAHSNRKSV